MSKTCSLAALVLVLALIPSCLANRDGAPAESCFDHAVVHLNPQLPTTLKQDCVGQCEYNFNLVDEVDATDFSSRLGTNVSDTFMLTCGSVYEFELTPGLNIGFLVQARESATFDVDSPIRGEWVEVGTIENYKILLCRRSSGSLMNESTFANSATQRNIVSDEDHFITTLYWRAPATPVNVTFYYTIVAGFSTFYNPLFTPRMSVQCDVPTSASTGTTTDSSPGVTGSTTTTTTSTTATDSTTATATDSTTATATGRITPTTETLSENTTFENTTLSNTTLSSNGRQGQQVSLMVVFGWLLLISTILY